MKSVCMLSRALFLVAGVTLAMASSAETILSAQPDFEAQMQERAQMREQARKEIAQQRKAIEARKQDAEKACWKRFAVEDCLRKVRTQAREEDNALHATELRLNTEERQDKAAQRQRAIAQKQGEKHVPAPVQVTPRGGVEMGTAHPIPATVFPEGKSAAEIESAQTQRDREAQARALAQAQRQQKQQAEVVEREREQAERSAAFQKEMQDKQAQAEKRRASKADDIAKRKGAPLPIPEGLPKP